MFFSDDSAEVDGAKCGGAGTLGSNHKSPTHFVYLLEIVKKGKSAEKLARIEL